jgi:hypothetical protein
VCGRSAPIIHKLNACGLVRAYFGFEAILLFQARRSRSTSTLYCIGCCGEGKARSFQGGSIPWGSIVREYYCTP